MPRKRQLTFQQAETIRAAYEAGETQVALATRFGVSQVCVSRVVNKKVLVAPRARKLSADQVQGLRYRFLTSAKTLKQLGAELNLSASEAKGIIDGDLYRDVPTGLEEGALQEEIRALFNKALDNPQ